MFGLGRALAAIGVEVGYVAHPRMAATCETFAARRIAPGGANGGFTLRAWSSPDETRQTAAHLGAAIDAFAPDVLVATPFGYGPAIASEATGLPLAVIGGLTFLWGGHAWRHQDGLRSYEAARLALGLAPLGARAAEAHPPWLGDLVLLQSVPSLSGAARPGERLAWVGDCSWDPPHERDPALTAWLADAERAGRGVVYAQSGREFGVAPIDQHLATIGDELGLAVAIDTARSDQPRRHAQAWLHVRPFIPRGDVLPSARLVVASGQPTVVLGALAHRVPLVLLANGSGTDEAAAACEAAGVARAGRLEGTTVDTLRALIGDALGGHLQPAVERVARELEAAGGPRRAAEHVVDLARAGRVAAVA
jgi:hypothetical protein